MLLINNKLMPKKKRGVSRWWNLSQWDGRTDGRGGGGGGDVAGVGAAPEVLNRVMLAAAVGGDGGLADR